MDGLEQQSLAYSKDNGRTWTKYKGNPVLPNNEGKDFRDPKSFLA
ncbi:glycoside hydrolase family 32 protein [Bacillus megaterium]|nr:glycoside hydrolase family 32 protein [Priestia megaterium]